MTDRLRRWTEPLARALAPADDTPRDVMGSILLNLAVLVAYSIAGLVVLVFGIGQAKISPIYPPAGIAVAATAILGPRILPAVFLGQFLNGFPLLAEPHMTLASYVLANTGTSVAAMLEASISVALLRQLAGTWHPFERPRDVVIFLVGSCLAAALVGGMVGTLSLWATGIVPTEEFANHVGDVLSCGRRRHCGVRVSHPRLVSRTAARCKRPDHLRRHHEPGNSDCGRRSLDRLPNQLSLPATVCLGWIPGGCPRRHACRDGDHRHRHCLDHPRCRSFCCRHCQRVHPSAPRLHRCDHVYRAHRGCCPRPTVGGGGSPRSS